MTIDCKKWNGFCFYCFCDTVSCESPDGASWGVKCSDYDCSFHSGLSESAAKAIESHEDICSLLKVGRQHVEMIDSLKKIPLKEDQIQAMNFHACIDHGYGSDKTVVTRIEITPSREMIALEFAKIDYASTGRMNSVFDRVDEFLEKAFEVTKK